MWSIIIPVKSLGRAKSRLSPTLTTVRPKLALAFACDAVCAVTTCEEVSRVLVVTADEVAAQALYGLGADIVTNHAEAGLNAAIMSGARATPRSYRLAVVTADLPCLRPAELATVLAAAGARTGRSFVADIAGLGTTFLAAGAGRDLRPRFGPASSEAHRRSGAELIPDAAAGIRRDVDTVMELSEAISLGVGAFTQKVLQDHGLDTALDPARWTARLPHDAKAESRYPPSESRPPAQRTAAGC